MIYFFFCIHFFFHFLNNTLFFFVCSSSIWCWCFGGVVDDVDAGCKVSEEMVFSEIRHLVVCKEMAKVESVQESQIILITYILKLNNTQFLSHQNISHY